jgi:hypothetical protein
MGKSSDAVLASSRFVDLLVPLHRSVPTDAGPPVRHSITSSARTTMDGGMVIPSALVVLRLTINWNLAARSIGSAGLHLKI